MINKHSHYSLSIFINLKNVLFCVVLIFILYATFGCSAMKSSQKAPEFDITLYQTEDYSEGDLYRFTKEKSLPIVLNFWFPSCPPCVAEMPEINNLYKEHKNDVEVVGIQLVGLDSVDDGKNFVKDTSISYAVGSDPDGSISVAYGVSGFPTTFFIDSKGYVLKTWEGAINADQLKQNINLILSND